MYSASIQSGFSFAADVITDDFYNVNGTVVALPPDTSKDRLEFSFTNDDLSVSGMLVRTHTKGDLPSSVIMFNPSGELIEIDLTHEEAINNYSVTIPMQGMKDVGTGAIAPGVWLLIVGFM